jgi:hypothetical protein
MNIKYKIRELALLINYLSNTLWRNIYKQLLIKFVLT